MEDVEFVVAQAGCSSCATRVRDALAELGMVQELAIDEAADVARVSLSGSSVSEDGVNDALRKASAGAGHEYRVQPGSWRVRA